MRYLLSLSFQDGYGLPAQRWVERDSLNEAQDAASRWLRLHHNTSAVFGRRYDQWSVAHMTPCRGVVIIATGHLNA